MIRYVHVPKKHKEVIREQDGSVTLTQQNLKTICLIQGLYQYPQLNNKLYLHFKSITRIQNLQPYINLKALYLQNNLIKEIQNIECLTLLQSLFLNNNMISKIKNINCPELKILNLSNNQIHVIQNLDHLRSLQTLTLSKNFLSSFESLEHLGSCSETLTNIDLTENKIEGDDRIIPLFSHVKCLYLIGNPFVKDISYYRRRMIGQLPNLVYLDQKGIDQTQRMRCEAWVKDGEQGLQRVNKEIQEMKAEQKIQRSKQIMKSAVLHKLRRINLFRSGIQDSRQQIKRCLASLATNPNKEFYLLKLKEEQLKIHAYTQSIQSMQKYIQSQKNQLKKQ